VGGVAGRAYRRIHLKGNLALDDGGWSSGGFIADTKVDGQIRSGSQQQFLTRNSQMGSWTGSNWNMVFVGDQGAPASSFPSPPDTTVGSAPSSGRSRSCTSTTPATTTSSFPRCAPTPVA